MGKIVQYLSAQFLFKINSDDSRDNASVGETFCVTNRYILHSLVRGGCSENYVKRLQHVLKQ